MAEMLIVKIDEQGTMHFEDGRLIVGDLDVVKLAAASAGLHRQRGRVVLEMYVQSKDVTNASPDLDGTFAEGSEP